MTGSLIMDTPTDWIALLDDDEDDFMFWQYGFDTWGQNITLKWFVSAESFLEEASRNMIKPTAIVLDGIVPDDEEEGWLKVFLSHVCCQHIPVFILTGQFNEEHQKRFLALGATDYLIKPISSEELQEMLLKVANTSGRDLFTH